MIRKILISVIVVLVLILIAVGIWAVFFAGKGDQEPSNRITGPNVTIFPDSEINPDAKSTGNSLIDRPFDIAKNERIPRLRQISNKPVAGFTTFEYETAQTGTFVEENDATTTVPKLTVFRFVDKATGHIYQTHERTLETERLVANTIPQVQTALLTGATTTALFQYVIGNNSSVETIITQEIPVESQESDLRFQEDPKEYSTLFLPIDISNVLLSPNGRQFAYTVLLEQGMRLFTGNLGISDTTLKYESPFKSWKVEWPVETVFSLLSKPDSRALGHFFLFDLLSGKETRILGDVFGLIAKISPNLRYVIYSAVVEGETRTYVFNRNENRYTQIVQDTLADKCVWGHGSASTTAFCAIPNQNPGANQPESWYQGKNHFNDKSILAVDGKNIFYDEYILERDDTQKSLVFDMTDVEVSKDNEYFIFRNKIDSTLWSYDLKG